jgi:hypothetical protein
LARAWVMGPSWGVLVVKVWASMLSGEGVESFYPLNLPAGAGDAVGTLNRCCNYPQGSTIHHAALHPV